MTTLRKLAGGTAALVMTAGAVVSFVLASPAHASSQSPYPGPFAGPGTHYGEVGDVTGWSAEQSTGIVKTYDANGNLTDVEIVPATIYRPPGFDQGVFPTCQEAHVACPTLPMP